MIHDEFASIQFRPGCEWRPLEDPREFVLASRTRMPAHPSPVALAALRCEQRADLLSWLRGR
jgi:hypothetical protein